MYILFIIFLCNSIFFIQRTVCFVKPEILAKKYFVQIKNKQASLNFSTVLENLTFLIYNFLKLVVFKYIFVRLENILNLFLLKQHCL